MAKITLTQVAKFQLATEVWLGSNLPTATRLNVLTGRDAWIIAHRAGITNECYLNRDITDGHIQTALEKIFPNAVFKDKKPY